MARSLPRRKPQTARTGGKDRSDRATPSPPERKPASHRTTIVNRSIIALWALDIRWFLLPNTHDRKKRSFCCSSTPVAASAHRRHFFHS